MTTKAPKHIPFPTKDDVLRFIEGSQGEVGRREIARAFNILGPQRADLRRLIKELEDDGSIERSRGRGRRFAPQGSLPEVCVLVVTGQDAEGDLLCRPLDWPEGEEPPRIFLWPAPRRKGRAAGPEIGVGDHVLSRLARRGDDRYDAKPIKRLAQAPLRILGVIAAASDGLRLRPTNKKDRNEYRVDPTAMKDAEVGDLVEAEALPGRRLGLRKARVLRRLGDADGPDAISLVAIHTHGIPVDFPVDAVAQAEAAVAAPLGDRTDLRAIPLVTIDGEDARDFDDAVFAQPDDDPANPGGWQVLVAIADVSWYVRPGDALDQTARERGNSVYFPDRVVPMLPEALSNGWCSLRPDEDRPCMAVWMTFDADGRKLRHRFVRGLMRSAARLTYHQVQAARDGMPAPAVAPLLEPVITPLYGAYRALARARKARGTLELDLPERKVVVGDDGQVLRVEPRARLDSHKLIEEFMIAANVCAAETLEQRQQPCVYRVHDQPSPEKVHALSEFLLTLDIRFSKSAVNRPSQFNGILDRVRGTAEEPMVNEVVLRSQAQAEYTLDNIGHFGLALHRYAHFTSPIRRYSDLLVHRALIRGLGLGDGGLPPDARTPDVLKDLEETCIHITATERRAAQAERDALNRFTTSFLANRVGATFEARINGVTRAGLFVTLLETGADGLVPIGTLPQDYYIHEEGAHCLRGQATGQEFRLGEAVEVMLREVNPVAGSLIFSVLQGGAGGSGRSSGGPARGARGVPSRPGGGGRRVAPRGKPRTRHGQRPG